MKKVAVFTEGHSEIIFLRKVLPIMFPLEILSFECFAVIGDSTRPIPYKFQSPNAEIHFLLVSVGNDERILTMISDREEGLVSKGYNQIIGLRDMYCEAYRKRSNDIDDSITNLFIEEYNVTINKMSNTNMIHVFFAIMEFEAWLLSMYNLLPKFAPSLSCAYIESQLGFNLHDVDPQIEFFHPAVDIGEILALVGVSYRKSQNQMESIISHIDEADIYTATERGRCKSLASFLSKVRSLYESEDN